MSTDLYWQRLATRPDTRILQSFTCTSEDPRSEGRRRLPHPRPWEKEAQTLLRQLSHNLKPGDVALTGSIEDEILACAHLQFTVDDDIFEAYHAAAAVALAVRNQGGQVADALLTEAQAVCSERALKLGCTNMVLSGRIHVSNMASQRMVARSGWEPRDLPTTTYQTWFRIVPLI